MPKQKEPSMTSNNDKGSDLMGSCIEFLKGFKLDPATEVPEFVPIRHELCELLRFWYRIRFDDYLVAAGAVGALEVFSIGHRIFKSIEYWYGSWKTKAALAA